MTSYQPHGWPTVIPRIFTNDVRSVVGFLKSVLGAEGELRTDVPTELRIGDSLIMVSDGGGVRDAMPAFFYVYMGDADSTYRTAIMEGALTIEEPVDMPYGDRRATVRDPWGNIWQIATHRGSSA
jgi:uncharacterized glyoxalase superfamily protein PhnB